MLTWIIVPFVFAIETETEEIPSCFPPFPFLLLPTLQQIFRNTQFQDTFWATHDQLAAINSLKSFVEWAEALISRLHLFSPVVGLGWKVGDIQCSRVNMRVG